MRTLRFALLALVRDWKSGELAVLLAALLVAVTSLTAVGFFTDRIAQAVALRAGEVIAADLRLRSAEPPSADYLEAARARGLAATRVASFPSMAHFGEASSLAAVRAVGEGYPLRGTLRVADEAFGPGRPSARIPAPGEAWPDSRLLASLGARVGDTIELGALRLRVGQVLEFRPDQGSNFVDLAATLLINHVDLEASGLLQAGSRSRHFVLFAGAPAQVRAFKAELESRKLPGERLVDAAEESPQIQSAVERAGRFLNLSALVTVLLSAVAVAMAARRYVRRHLDNVALMKCMGASQGFVLRVVVLELALLGLAAALLGALLGYTAQAGIAGLLRELIRDELPPPGGGPLLLGLATAVIVLIGFALPPLLQLKRVPPARVLRRNLEPPPLRYAAAYVFALGALLALLFTLVRDLRLVAYVAAGTLVAIAVLLGAGWALVRAAGRLRGGVGISWRYGLANLSRRGPESVAQVVAFGLGLMVLLLLAVVRNDLIEEWQASLPADTPNHFLINIAQSEAEAFGEFFAARGLEAPRLYPMIRARMTAINGEPMAERAARSDRGRGFAEREQNLSWSAELAADNTLVEGRWWDGAEAGRPLLSVATDYRDELGLALGDRITFDVAGESVEAEVANFREVQWDSFRPNFFLVFSPGALDGMVGTFLTAVRLEPAQRPVLADLVRRFPGVSVYDVEAILSQVRDVMDRASLAVQFVFLFTIVAGVTVLLAAIQSTRDERRYESAMLRTLGASRRVVLKGVAAEFTALGLLAGVLAAVGATAGGWIIATELFNLPYELDPTVWGVGLVLGVLLVGGAGTWAARSVVNHPPIATLRQ